MGVQSRILFCAFLNQPRLIAGATSPKCWNIVRMVFPPAIAMSTSPVGLIRANDRYPVLHSLLIVRHGYLIVEEYFASHLPDAQPYRNFHWGNRMPQVSSSSIPYRSSLVRVESI